MARRPHPWRWTRGYRPYADKAWWASLPSEATPGRCARYSIRSETCWPARPAKERRLDILAEFAGRLVSSERNDADLISLRSLPFAMEPGTGNDEVRGRK